ncbi:hypothetical protein [Kitasatospora sp. NPDC127116]|uniref:phage scaffolding protein n=1 Tax=Kitasatospora sp. NPDC127116 TaxID=3345367 RepID=UPI0036395E59
MPDSTDPLLSAAELPVHPITGLIALGWRKPRPGEHRFQPIWPILGGAPGDGDDDPVDEPDDDSPDDGDDEPDDEPLGDAGTKALAAEKARRKAEADRRRVAEKRAADLEAELAAAKQGDGGPDPDQIRRDATTAATARANERILRSEVRAAAAGKLSDPRDALRFLDLDKFEVDEDGQVDEDEIADAIADLLKSKPYLAATAGSTKPRFEGTGDGGARKAPTGPRQLTEADVKKMTPEQIDEAHRKGQLRDYMGS